MYSSQFLSDDGINVAVCAIGVSGKQPNQNFLSSSFRLGLLILTVAIFGIKEESSEKILRN
jgi:hypothetical protein